MMMIFAILLLAASIAIALVTASPLYRTLSIAIDTWADEVHGDEIRPLR